jgi:hypothetical protein
MRKSPIITLIALVNIIMLTSCNLPRPNSTPTSGIQVSVQTIAAMTVEAILTQSMPSNTPLSPTKTYTSIPTNTLAATQLPSITTTPQLPTITITSQITTSVTPTSAPCDRATFVSETFPDDSEVSPEGMFSKTWTLKNNGICTWNSGYSIVFVKGDAMTTIASQPLTTGTVTPGESIKISINLKAPSTDGTYRGYWMLRNANGVLFGLGADAGNNFWVQAKVVGPKISFFVDNYCAAKWTSSAGNLPCPGQSSDQDGFVIRLDAPKLQNGTVDNDIALWTNPQPVTNGTIAGKYPAITISTGQHFMSVIGCLYKADNCNVKFSLIANADGGTDQILKEWNLKYTSPITFADVDLSSLAGKSVVFTLKVTIISGADQAQAYWLKPRLQP